MAIFAAIFFQLLVNFSPLKASIFVGMANGQKACVFSMTTTTRLLA